MGRVCRHTAVALSLNSKERRTTSGLLLYLFSKVVAHGLPGEGKLLESLTCRSTCGDGKRAVYSSGTGW